MRVDKQICEQQRLYADRHGESGSGAECEGEHQLPLVMRDAPALACKRRIMRRIVQ